MRISDDKKRSGTNDRWHIFFICTVNISFEIIFCKIVLDIMAKGERSVVNRHSFATFDKRPTLRL